MTRWRRRAVIGAAMGAVVYLATMAASGGRRESQWLVRFQAAGLMTETPEHIDRVEVMRAGNRLIFHRAAAGGWTAGAGGHHVLATLASDIDMSIRFMHVAAPIRVMGRDEWHGQRRAEYGLEPPSYAIALHHGDQVVLSGRFGSVNPQEVSQYVSVDGREQLYLMPRFIGRQWERVVEASEE